MDLLQERRWCIILHILKTDPKGNREHYGAAQKYSKSHSWNALEDPSYVFYYFLKELFETFF